MGSFTKIVSLLLLPICAVAQHVPEWGFINVRQADSLLSVLKNTANDSIKMRTCRSLGFYYLEKNNDSSLYFYDQQLEFSKKLNLKIWQADAYSQRGYELTLLGKYPESFESLSEGLKIAGDPANESSNWHISTFSNSDNFQHSRLAVLATVHLHMGYLFGVVNEKEKQNYNYDKAIEIGENIHNGNILSVTYLSICWLHSVDTALIYLRKALTASEESDYRKFQGEILLAMAGVYYYKNNIDSARKYLSLSVRVNQEQNDLKGLMYSYNYVAVAYTQQKNKDSSLYFAKKVLQTASLSSSSDLLLLAYGTMSDAYKLRNDIDSAYKYIILQAKLNDSLKNARIDKLTEFQNFAFNEQLRSKKAEEERTAYQSKIKISALIAGLAVLLLIGIMLFRNNRQKQKANKILQQQKNEVQDTLTKLRSTQAQLIQSEKMASLGELTAGIAHEIQNPLNFVNNFSEVNKELLTELKQEARSGNNNEVISLADAVSANEEKIIHHGKRADAIVKGMLQHSRSSTGVKELTDINALAAEYLRLAYHGWKAKDQEFTALIKTEFDERTGKVNVIPQDIGRVLLNLYNNAFYAVAEKKKSVPTGYEPVVTLSTHRIDDKVEIKVEDNGTGIPQKVRDKIFQPFFTTKPTGVGTGLGLSLSYDIVKAHGGELKVETKEGEGSEFTFVLPV